MKSSLLELQSTVAMGIVAAARLQFLIKRRVVCFRLEIQSGCVGR
jgi:hypothetical protein